MLGLWVIERLLVMCGLLLWLDVVASLRFIRER